MRRKIQVRAAMGLFLMLFLATAYAQGVLSVTPGRSIATTAGIGSVGYTGDGGVATSATLAKPWAVTYDRAGNLFIADANNHVVREVVKSSGNIVTVAGTGVAGFSGDGGAATSAQLDTPTGVAVDVSGSVLIADSHNQRVRKIVNGTITTVAGNGTAAFNGDGGAAVAASLSLPTSVAVDASGNVFIADTNNQRVRRISNGTITTVAGSSEQGYAGDGALATNAQLDSPAGVAVDATGNLYIADSHNQRVRQVSGGTITTLAGSGLPTFGGGFGGDNASAASAALANPTGVSVDSNGVVTIADTNNQRVRQVGGGSIATIAGDGTQAPNTLNAPRGVATDGNGNLSIADTRNQRVRGDALGSLTLANAQVGVASASQPVTLANTGTGSITVSSIAFNGPFVSANGGTCSAAPVTLAAGASCTQNIVFLPTMLGATSGSVNFGGTGVLTQSVLLSGTAVQGASATTLVSSNATPLAGSTVTFTATVAPVGSGVAPIGSVTFLLNGSTPIGSGTVSAQNKSVSINYTLANSGAYTVTAVYAGDANYAGSSATLSQQVGDFSFSLSSGSNVSLSVPPGDTATYNFVLAPLNGPFSFPITLSAIGLPAGATAVFTPSTVTLGSSPATFTMAIKTAPLTAMLHRAQGMGGAAMAIVLLVVPFAGRKRKLHRLLVVMLALGSLVTVGALSGCGSGSGFFGQGQNTYNIVVTGTAAGPNGTALQHSATVTLTVQ